MYAPREIVVLQNGLTQEVVAMLRTVAAKGLLVRHLVDGLVHGLNHRRAKRLCHIADAKADDALFGMRHLESVHLLGNVGEQVIVRQL